MSVFTSERRHSFAYQKTVTIPPIRNAHQAQLPATPFWRTMSVTRLGVSVEKVVATMEVPSIHHATRMRGTGITWERPGSEEVHYKAIFDDNGRIMCIICHNTDLGDGWEREGEDECFKKWLKINNHQLLWHGSRTTNFAGILSQGLRIAPPEAPMVI